MRTLAAILMISTAGCASAPPAVDDRPVVHIFRQVFVVPAPPVEEECCWYEKPADTDYGPI